MGRRATSASPTSAWSPGIWPARRAGSGSAWIHKTRTARLTSVRRSPTATIVLAMHIPNSSSPKPADAVLLLGVDDSEKIWVNGSEVFQHFTARGLVVDQDRVSVHLEAGTNTILLKVYQNTLGWEFCARLVTTDGKPLPLTQKAD